MSERKISVIIGTHNGGKTIERAINSVYEQTLEPTEVIVCNDFSNDDTLEVLQKLKKKYKTLKIINNEKNLGLAKSLNKCIKESTGNYIARMDDDDFSLPKRFEQQVKFLELNKDFAFVSCIVFTTKNGKITGEIVRPETFNNKVFIKGTPYIHPTVMFRRQTLEKNDGYSELEIVSKRAQDYELFARLASKGFRGYNLQEKLFLYEFDLASFAKKKKASNIVNQIKLKIHIFRMMKYPLIVYPMIFQPVYVFMKAKIRTVLIKIKQ